MRTWAMAFVGLALTAGTASAHFLFIRIGEHAEGGRAAEVYFSERAAAGDPKFVDKIAGTKLWLQSAPGEFVPLNVRKSTDRLRALVPTDGAASVTGICEYGVLQRDVAFLLRYYPKAISGPPEKLNALQTHAELPLEIVAKIAGAQLELSLLQRGKPVPEAVFTTVDDNLVNEELRADAAGKAIWKPTTAGQCCVYAKATLPESGESGGKRYTEIREFATLALAWPLGRQDADPEAVKLFQGAIAARAAWQSFPGFTADISGVVDGRSFHGQVKITANGELALKGQLSDEAAVDWVEDQLKSLVLHRKAPTAPRAEPVLRFGDNDTEHPLGRLLIFSGGRFASSYRVRDDELTVVNRNLGSENMTITVLDSERNPDGKSLPRSYTVQYWDAVSGDLLRTENFQNRWERVGTFDLPAVNTLSTAAAGGLTVRSFTLTNHTLLPMQ